MKKTWSLWSNSPLLRILVVAAAALLVLGGGLLSGAAMYGACNENLTPGTTAETVCGAVNESDAILFVPPALLAGMGLFVPARLFVVALAVALGFHAVIFTVALSIAL